MLTFVQIDLIKLKKKKCFLSTEPHCLLLSLSLGLWGSKALGPHFESTWPGQRWALGASEEDVGNQSSWIQPDSNPRWSPISIPGG